MVQYIDKKLKIEYEETPLLSKEMLDGVVKEVLEQVDKEILEHLEQCNSNKEQK